MALKGWQALLDSLESQALLDHRDPPVCAHIKTLSRIWQSGDEGHWIFYREAHFVHIFLITDDLGICIVMTATTYLSHLLPSY